MAAISNDARNTCAQTDMYTIIGRHCAYNTYVRICTCASRATNSAVGPFRDRQAQVLISYLFPHLITVIGRVARDRPIDHHSLTLVPLS